MSVSSGELELELILYSFSDWALVELAFMECFETGPKVNDSGSQDHPMEDGVRVEPNVTPAFDVSLGKFNRIDDSAESVKDAASQPGPDQHRSTQFFVQIVR